MLFENRRQALKVRIVLWVSLVVCAGALYGGWAIMQTYGPSQQPIAGGRLSGVQPHVENGIVLDVQPIPVRVPRKSVGAAYARAREGTFR